MSEGDAETDGGRGKTEVGKLNLLCDTLRAWVSTNVASLSLSSIFFFSTTLSRCWNFFNSLSRNGREFRVTRELSRNGISLSLLFPP